MDEHIEYPLKNYIADLAHYITPYRVKFFTGVILRLTSDLANLFPAWALSQIVLILSRPLERNSFQNLLLIFITWGVLTIYYGIVHNLSKNLGYQVSEKASLDLYKETLAHIFRLDYAWQETEDSGNKMKRIDKGLDGVDNTIRRIFDVLIEVVVNTIGIVIIFFTLDKSVAFELVIFILTYFLVGTVLLKKAVLQERLVNKSFEDLGGITYEALNNIQTIKALAIDRGVNKVVHFRIEALYQEIKRRIYLFRLQAGVLLLYQLLFEFGVIALITWGIIHGQYNVSLLVLFIGLFQKVSESTGELTDVTQQLAQAKIWISRAITILNTPPVIEHPDIIAQQCLYPESWQKIQLDRLSFSYKRKTALNDISLTINRGEKIGIVGLSGAGKSTLFKLLLDLYENYTGNIYFDKTPLKKIQRQSYIDHIAVVLQDTELFDMTLKENIKIAAVDGKQTNIRYLSDVIHMAHLDDVVSELPQGINTLVGEKGIRLSGGQRQRVGIARALYRKPDILLLDEATSHLDAHSEKQIQKALEENMQKFTTIVIAHRLSTIKAMDKIIVMAKGRVVEEGNFAALLAKKGVFAKMWQDQKI